MCKIFKNGYGPESEPAMLKILETSIDDLIAVKAAGILTGSDYDDVFPVIENAIKKYGKIRFFLDLDEFEGMDVSAILKDTIFAMSHRNDFKKMAAVGDQAWEDWVARAADVVTEGEVRHFQYYDKVEAFNWVRE